VDAEARVSAQASREQRLAAADRVLHNDGSRVDLRAQVDRLWDELRAASQPDGPDRR
jgi:dephospho-CoA kinase